MDFNDNNDENNNTNSININPSSRDIGADSGLENHYFSKTKDVSIQMDNNYQNEEIRGYEEEFKDVQKENEEEDEEEEEEEEEEENNFKNNLVPMENFSQQVDFLFHPNDPEWQTRIKPPKAKVIKKKKNLKNNKSKSKNKNKSKSKSKNKNVKKKQKMKFINKIRPEFNLCTKIDPQPKTQSIFYSRHQIDETRVEKQRRTRAEKIAEYEENYARQKEIYKAKRKKEEEDLKNNYIKSRTSNNFYLNKANPNNINNIEFLNQIKNLSKIEYPETDIRKYECNPQKYDGIIHSLLKEISQIKLQRERENEEFVNKIKRLQNDVDKNKNRKKSVKNRPKSGNKVKINNKKSNNVFNIIKNYHKQYKPRPKTGNKFKSNNISNNIIKKENEIPVDNNSNISKNNTKNNFYQTEKENILKNIQDLEMEKNIKINELMNQKESNDYFNNINEYNNNNFENYKNNIYEMSNYPNKNISKSENLNQHVMNLNNNIVYNPIQFNIMNNINPNVLNYQDKIQALTDLNNNIGKFTSSIPKLVNKVNETLNKIYGNTDNPIKKAINNHPLVIITSRATHKTMKSNIDAITEGLIEDLLYDCVYDLNAIDDEKKRREERKNLLEKLFQTSNNLNAICQNEVDIGNHYNINNGGRTNNII